MKDKNITTNDLARMIQKEFSESQKEFNKINLKLAKLDKIDGLERKVDKLERNDQIIIKRLEGVVYRTEFEKLEVRVLELENLLAVSAKKH